MENVVDKGLKAQVRDPKTSLSAFTVLAGSESVNAKNAEAKIKSLTDKAMELIRESQKIANEFVIDFSFDVAYGMGGRFIATRPEMTRRQALDKIEAGGDLTQDMKEHLEDVLYGTEEDDDKWVPSKSPYYDKNDGWISSSQDC